jgi:hypothetical protein
MILLALASLFGSLYVAVLAVMFCAIDPDQTLDGAGQWVKLTDVQKRRRFIWFIVGAMPCALLSILFLVQAQWSISDFAVLAVILVVLMWGFDRIRPKK